MEIDEELCVCLIDWQKAFDRVNWTKLMQILKGTDIDWRERRLISNVYTLFNKTQAAWYFVLVSKAKIVLHLFQQYFILHITPLKQGVSETTLSPDLPSTRIIRSTVPFRKCFK